MTPPLPLLCTLLTKFSTPFETADVPKGELPLDDNSSTGGSDEPETVQPYPIPLRKLETIILESTSFLTFRERYRAFLFPGSDPQSSATGIPAEGGVPARDSERPGPQTGSDHDLELEEKRSPIPQVLASVLRRFRRFMRPPVNQGYIRLEWTCVSEESPLLRALSIVYRLRSTKYRYQECGDDLYADFPESDGDSIRNLEVLLQSQADDNGGSTPSSHASTSCNPPTGGPSNSTPAPTPPPVPGQPNDARQTPGQGPDPPPPEGTDGGAHASGRTPGRARKRFLELCVNTGEFQRQLAEIDVSSVNSDAQLFDRIRQRYHEARSFRVKYFLLKPVDVHFVQFSVEDRYRVGILDKPMAIPSEADMAAEGYTYHPCPLKPPPIPAHIFLHHLSNPRPHKKLLWSNRIPQKLDNSILQIQSADDKLVTGWGVHVIEGLNRSAVLLCTLAGLLVSGIVSAAWAIARDDVQGGFGIGAWLTSVEAIVLMLVVTKWMET